MPKQESHSSQLIVVESADGRSSFDRQKLPQGVTAGSRWGAVPLDTLLAWASNPKSEGAARINAILELIAELGNLSHERGGEEGHHLAWQGRVFRVTTAMANMQRDGRPKTTDREEELAVKLNLKMRRYKLAPWYWATIGDFPILGWWSGDNRPRDEEEPEEETEFTEQDAIIAIIDAAREGLLCKVRRCHCGDWFYAKFAHQKFCCLKCQQRYYRSSDDYRAMRRAYMKMLRQQHKKTYFVSPKERARKRKSSSQAKGRDAK